MSTFDDIMKFNRIFVENKDYEQYQTTKFPNKKMVVLTCMDTRLLELLPRAMNLKNGDAKIIKNAGAMVSHPYGSIMRSILVALYELKASEVYVIGHHDCGMATVDSSALLNKVIGRGVSELTIQELENDGHDVRQWLQGFGSVHESVLRSVKEIEKHPLFPEGVPVHGLIIHPDTGALEYVMSTVSK